jgi:FkbM family methyltransferase
VKPVYRSAFDRLPEEGAIGNSVKELQSRTSVESLAENLVPSPEFQARHGSDARKFQLTPDEFVATLYRSVLRRSADPPGLAHWSNVIRGTGDYTAVLASFVASEEFKLVDQDTLVRPSPSSFTGGNVSVRYDSIGALAIDQTMAGLPPSVDVVVPVYNAERWICAICDGYDALGLRPLFIVEARSTDQSLAILLSRKTRVFTAQGKKPYVESLLSGIIPYLSSRWILRLDDDELPSYGLLRWVADNTSCQQEHSVAFPRYWVRRNGNGGWEMSDCRAIGGAWGADHQYRLFRPSDVVASDTIHTPGFEVSSTIAPDEARIYHFDWIVRSYDERVRKVERYEELQKGAGNHLAVYYLPEERDHAIYDFILLEDSLIETICERVTQTKSDRELGITNELERFDHLGVKLELPRHLVTPAIRRAFREGYYEALETQIIAKVLRPTDIVLELGAAVGFLATWISQRLTAGRVISYEANPSLIDVAANTFRLNDVNVTLRHAAVTGETGCELAEFFVHEDFWASSQIVNSGVRIEVAAEALQDILHSVRPDLIMVDIEGGELALFEHVELSGIRHAIVELHSAVIGQAGVRRVFQRMAELGFAYDPTHSSAHAITFSPVLHSPAGSRPGSVQMPRL